MELEMKLTCVCHQAKITICCQTPPNTPISPKNLHKGVFQHAESKFAIRIAL